ncbi:MAG: c-type cytochrome [bacterium]|nr:c-type cytochrome [bacterium]
MSENPQTTPSRRTAAWPVYLVLGLLGLFFVIFLSEFIDLSQRGGGETEITETTYLDVVEPLLANANPENGPALLQKHGCNACHAGQNAGHLGPPHSEVHAVAADRRPPLTAAAYIYESIVYPGAFILEEYDDVNMPRIYGEQIPDDELGDIIAYLLQPQSE